MLTQAIEWRKELIESGQHEKAEVLEYLIEMTEIVEEQLPLRAEVSE